jgi:hypothetical protein
MGSCCHAPQRVSTLSDPQPKELSSALRMSSSCCLSAAFSIILLRMTHRSTRSGKKTMNSNVRSRSLMCTLACSLWRCTVQHM